MPDLTIRDATTDDLPDLLHIHNWFIANSNGIWIEQEETLKGLTSWFNDRLASGFPVWVAQDKNGNVTGYASYGAYRGRDGYDLTIEHSIYIMPEAQGHGLGERFLKKLIEFARDDGRHVIVAIVDADNVPSIKLHEKFGFEYGGNVPQAGKKGGTWRDQATYYLVLDDRATP